MEERGGSGSGRHGALKLDDDDAHACGRGGRGAQHVLEESFAGRAQLGAARR